LGSEALPAQIEIVGPFANPETRERESVMECVGADQAPSQEMAEQGHRNLADLYRFTALATVCTHTANSAVSFALTTVNSRLEVIANVSADIFCRN